MSVEYIINPLPPNIHIQILQTSPSCLKGG